MRPYSTRPLVVCTALILAASLYVNFRLGGRETVVPRESLSAFPMSVGEWQGKGKGSTFPTEVLRSLGVDEYLARQYTDGEDSLWLYIGYYRSQREGAVPHSPRHCYPGSGWSPMRSDTASIPVRTGRGETVIRPNRYLFAKGDERECVIYWYQSRGRVISNEYVEKLYLVRDAVLRSRSDGALVRFSMKTRGGDEDRAFRKIESAVSRLYPQIPRFIPD
jgi:EpsI family protein